MIGAATACFFASADDVRAGSGAIEVPFEARFVAEQVIDALANRAS